MNQLANGPHGRLVEPYRVNITDCADYLGGEAQTPLCDVTQIVSQSVDDCRFRMFTALVIRW